MAEIWARRLQPSQPQTGSIAWIASRSAPVNSWRLRPAATMTPDPGGHQPRRRGAVSVAFVVAGALGVLGRTDDRCLDAAARNVEFAHLGVDLGGRHGGPVVGCGGEVDGQRLQTPKSIRTYVRWQQQNPS